MEAAPSRHSRNDFVLRACLIMNPHPVEAPPPFCTAHQQPLQEIQGWESREARGWRQRELPFAAARWPSFGLNCSVYYPCGISNYLFLLDQPLARMTLISLAATLRTFNWCVTSRQGLSSIRALTMTRGDSTLRIRREYERRFHARMIDFMLSAGSKWEIQVSADGCMFSFNLPALSSTVQRLLFFF